MSKIYFKNTQATVLIYIWHAGALHGNKFISSNDFTQCLFLNIEIQKQIIVFLLNCLKSSASGCLNASSGTEELNCQIHDVQCCN